MLGHGHGGGGGHHGGGHGGGGGGGGGGNWPRGGGYYAYEPTVYVMPMCPPIYAPVIGTDGMAYDNECLANAAGVAVAYRLPAGAVVNHPGQPSPIFYPGR